MASEGNNISGDAADFRDAYLEGSEGEHIEGIRAAIEKGDSYNAISFMNYIDYYVTFKKGVARKILDSHSDKSLTASAIRIWDLIITNAINFKILTQLEEEQNSHAKMLLVNVLHGMVEEGKFDEDQMAVVENLLGLVLSSIKDLHQELILER